MILGTSSVDRAPDYVANRDRNRLRVEAAISVRDLHGHVIDVVATSIGRRLKVWCCKK